MSKISEASLSMSEIREDFNANLSSSENEEVCLSFWKLLPPLMEVQLQIRSDVFSFGVILWELMTESIPVEGYQLENDRNNSLIGWIDI
ncbi:hypothetical protein BC332_25971 [Capsicum chinense]|nr:hypothetical protein BC332_25971 [Capsicum chinense]